MKEADNKAVHWWKIMLTTAFSQQKSKTFTISSSVAGLSLFCSIVQADECDFRQESDETSSLYPKANTGQMQC